MKARTLLVFSALGLGACQSNAVLLEALKYDVGPPPETHALQLAGTSLNANDNRGMSTEQAEAFFRVSQGEQVNYFGVIDDIRIRGNRAELELLPITASIAKKECEVADLRRRYGCQSEETRAFTTVTCVVRDWAALNQATGGRLLNNWRNRREDHRNWDGLQIEGNLFDLRAEHGTVGIYREGNLSFGQLGGLSTAHWAYQSFVVDGCRVRGYDDEIL